MAIVSISKIQVRRGQEAVTGLPQLDSGEFGWALDSQKLYIGNGTIQEGAPSVGNTEILTNHTIGNIFVFPAYTYVGHSPSAPLVTSPSGIGNTIRSAQSKLDDFVSIYDFSLDGTVLSSLSLQQAINQIYLNTDKNIESSRVVLRLPAGLYEISETVYLPPYVTLLGDGKGATVLSITVANKPIFQTVDQTSTPGNYVKFSPGAANILANTSPRNITLSGLTLEYKSSLSMVQTEPLLQLDCVTNTRIVNCEFRGSYTPGISAVSRYQYSGINIRGQSNITSKMLTVDDCTFVNLYAGITSNYDISGTTVNLTKFSNLHQGVVHNDQNILNNPNGPVNTHVTKCSFTNIESEGIYVGATASGSPTNFLSSFNTFNEVGNNILGDSLANTPIIAFMSNGNVSHSDYFSRDVSINNTSTSVTYIQSVKGTAYLERNEVVTSNISSASGQVLAKFPYVAGVQTLGVNYSINKNTVGIMRNGKLEINVGVLNGITTSTIADTYSYSGPTDSGVIFTVSTNTATSTISLGYSSPDSVGTIAYIQSQLQ